MSKKEKYVKSKEICQRRRREVKRSEDKEEKRKDEEMGGRRRSNRTVNRRVGDNIVCNRTFIDNCVNRIKKVKSDSKKNSSTTK